MEFEKIILNIAMPSYFIKPDAHTHTFSYALIFSITLSHIDTYSEFICQNIHVYIHPYILRFD